jgi:hypothetical protein
VTFKFLLLITLGSPRLWPGCRDNPRGCPSAPNSLVRSPLCSLWVWPDGPPRPRTRRSCEQEHPKWMFARILPRVLPLSLLEAKHGERDAEGANGQQGDSRKHDLPDAGADSMSRDRGPGMVSGPSRNLGDTSSRFVVNSGQASGRDSARACFRTPAEAARPRAASVTSCG